MRIRRAVIIRTILALSAAASIMAGSAAPALAASAHSAHLQTVVAHGGSQVFYHT